MTQTLTLYRTDPARNMVRFYHLDLQQDLFGAWCVVCEWGRIGRTGRTRSIPFSSPNEAAVSLDRRAAAKRRRGYTLAG